jgi:hypothetical protein
MKKFDSKKLMKSLTAGQGNILAPHIDTYLSKRNFPPVWQITIPNMKAHDSYFHPSGDCFTTPLNL